MKLYLGNTRSGQPTTTQKGITVVFANGCWWLFMISFLIVCSTVDWLAGPCNSLTDFVLLLLAVLDVDVVTLIVMVIGIAIV